jgi:RNA polymerase sigma-70 factor (ECF subfamily)
LAYDLETVIEADRSAGGSDLDDAGLMERIEARHEESLRMLYQRHAAALFALCLRILTDRTDAEQILLDVFWEVWDRADRYDAARAAPLTYLTILTRSRALDLLRKRKSAVGSESRGGANKTQSLDASLASSALPPLNHLLADERSKSVRDALLSLDDDERSLIEACFYDGCTHVELAARLRQPLGTVKTRIRRGLLRLRTRLSRIYDEPSPASENAFSSDSEAR